METVLTLAVWSAEHRAPEWTEHCPLMDYGAFVAMSTLSTRQEGAFAPASQLYSDGWKNAKETETRCLIRVELPDGIEVGDYPVGKYQLFGLFGNYDARDGMGQAVYAFVLSPVPVEGDNYESAFDQAIQNGIQLSIPKQGGGREQVSIPVLERSPVFRAFHDPYPAGWQ